MLCPERLGASATVARTFQRPASGSLSFSPRVHTKTRELSDRALLDLRHLSTETLISCQSLLCDWRLSFLVLSTVSGESQFPRLTTGSSDTKPHYEGHQNHARDICSVILNGSLLYCQAQQFRKMIIISHRSRRHARRGRSYSRCGPSSFSAFSQRSAESGLGCEVLQCYLGRT
jgi:hypothetical protein